MMKKLVVLIAALLVPSVARAYTVYAINSASTAIVFTFYKSAAMVDADKVGTLNLAGNKSGQMNIPDGTKIQAAKVTASTGSILATQTSSLSDVQKGQTQTWTYAGGNQIRVVSQAQTAKTATATTK